ncbi:hypothetical protein EW146_g1276 [Bondarzewia mesenterica]|uniref:AMP-dependent synthetase/ligase domain-containing protein n=1 Tax=Bondarzewia mesenterica TaxID=1095465 RepID=A0A4S4M6P7_9AGAM|nr:hypothetical protein EW146_g1276 [Bondarzewia mesenterica]
MSFHAAQAAFKPTPESIPPPNVDLVLHVHDGLPPNIHPLNPLQFLLRGAQLCPDHLALAHPDVPFPAFYTYSVWAQRVQNFSYGLIQAGIQPGDRIAVIAPNSPMIADALQGVIGARAIATTINVRLTKPEVAYILEHSGAKIIFADHEYAHLVEGAKARVITCKDTGRAGDPYEEFLSAGRRFSQERGWAGLEMEADENKPLSLNYTSGTTGRPKGVLTTLRGSYLAAIANAYETQILPMFHAAGWTYPWATTFAFATQLTLRTINYPLIWKHLLHSNVTHYCGAPTVQIGIVNDPNARKIDHKVMTIIAGAAPTAHLLGELEKKGIQPVHVYGLTASPPGTLVDVPKDGKTVGEIVMRGNIVMHGYFNDAEATSLAFEGGWFHSGDLAVWREDGSIAIQDRSKDIIISGGENASSLAIEQELASHLDVLEVSVVGREHPKWGERPMAFVILRPDAVKEWAGKHPEFANALKVHARARLPGFATPEWVVVVEELPKTSTGKILKTTLRKRAAEAAAAAAPVKAKL